MISKGDASLLDQARTHGAALLALLPQLLQEQRATLLADVRLIVREEIERAAQAREVLDLPELLNIDQAAALLKLRPPTVRKRLRENPALAACLVPTGRRRGRGADLAFDRDKLLAFASDGERR